MKPIRYSTDVFAFIFLGDHPIFFRTAQKLIINLFLLLPCTLAASVFHPSAVTATLGTAFIDGKAITAMNVECRMAVIPFTFNPGVPLPYLFDTFLSSDRVFDDLDILVNSHFEQMPGGTTSSFVKQFFVPLTNAIVGDFYLIVRALDGAEASQNPRPLSGYAITDARFAISTSTNVTLAMITLQPNAQTVEAGENVTFTVVANGTLPLSYQWLKNGQRLGDSEAVSGSSGPILRLKDVQEADTATFSVVITNPAGKISSAPAALVTKPRLPAIKEQPVNQFAGTGGSAFFNISAIGSKPMRCQWQHNGLDIQNQTNSTLILSNVQRNDQGSYAALLSNNAGNVKSIAVSLTVFSNSNGVLDLTAKQYVPSTSEIMPHGETLESFTVEAWVLARSNEPALLISNDIYWLSLEAHGVTFQLNNFTAYRAIITNQFQWYTNQWTHIAGQFEATTKEITLAVNGTIAGKGSRFDADRFEIMGDLKFGFGFGFNGQIAEARISNIVRYTNDYIVPAVFMNDAHTRALYRFDEENGSSVLKDSSGNNYDLFLNDAKIVREPSPSVSEFRLFNVSRKRSTFSVSVATSVGVQYVLEFKKSILDPVWSPLITFTGDGLDRVLSDQPTDNASRFYRIRTNR